MGDTCFFFEDAKRPDPPFTRTNLRNVMVGGTPPPTLFVNGVAVTSANRKKYRLFRSSQLVGDYQFTWHHNIPWNILRKSWDLVITFCTEECIVGLFDFYTAGHPYAYQAPGLLAKVLLLRRTAGLPLARRSMVPPQVKRSCGEWVDHLVKTMKESTDPAMTLLGEERDELKTILCWGAWNLNEGPGTRVDDPDELFDSFGPFDATELRKPRYVAVDRLDKTLNRIVDDYKKLKDTPYVPDTTSHVWSKELMETLRVCQGLTPDQRKIVFFDPLMWAPVTLSANAASLFNLATSVQTEDGMIVEVLRGVQVFKQMKKCVRWR